MENPALMSELRALRQRKDELETHLATLQDSRRQLMVQLEGLMKMLKVCPILKISNRSERLLCNTRIIFSLFRVLGTKSRYLLIMRCFIVLGRQSALYWHMRMRILYAFNITSNVKHATHIHYRRIVP